MRSSSCPRGSTLTTVKSRSGLFLVALAAAVAMLALPAGAASKPKHRLQKFGSCSRFVHYARRHALNELKTRGVPAPAPLPVRAPQPVMNDGTTVQGEAAPTTGAGQDFST